MIAQSIAPHRPAVSRRPRFRMQRVLLRGCHVAVHMHSNQIMRRNCEAVSTVYLRNRRPARRMTPTHPPAPRPGSKGQAHRSLQEYEATATAFEVPHPG